MDILNRITQLREDRGWSEYRLAKESGIPQSTISNLYKRKNSPTISTLESICDAFGITLSQFFSEAEDNGNMTEQQQEFLKRWALLSPHQKELVNAFTLGILANDR